MIFFTVTPRDRNDLLLLGGPNSRRRVSSGTVGFEIVRANIQKGAYNLRIEQVHAMGSQATAGRISRNSLSVDVSINLLRRL